jgi:hypothetical protein
MCDKDGGWVMVSDDHSECGCATSDKNGDERGWMGRRTDEGAAAAGFATRRWRVPNARRLEIGITQAPIDWKTETSGLPPHGEVLLAPTGRHRTQLIG